MDIENHVLIEIAFSVYNIPDINNQLYYNEEEPFNAIRAKHLAIKLLVDINHLNFVEVGKILHMSSDAAHSAYGRLTSYIKSPDIDWKVFHILSRYRKANAIIICYIQADAMNCEEK